jgi:DNA-binding NarL/FixJ family response regulator
MRVFLVSSHPLFGQGMEEWLRQGTGLTLAGRENSLATVARRMGQVQPDVILLDISHKAKALTAALLRFFGDKSGAKIIGVDLQDNGVRTYCDECLLMKDVADLLEVIQELGNAACS